MSLESYIYNASIDLRGYEKKRLCALEYFFCKAAHWAAGTKGQFGDSVSFSFCLYNGGPLSRRNSDLIFILDVIHFSTLFECRCIFNIFN